MLLSCTSYSVNYLSFVILLSMVYYSAGLAASIKILKHIPVISPVYIVTLYPGEMVFVHAVDFKHNRQFFSRIISTFLFRNNLCMVN